MKLLYLGMAAGIFGGEYLIKNKVEKERKLHEETPLLRGRLLVRRYHNEGAFLNMGEKRRPLVCALSVAMTTGAAILFLVTLGTKGNHLLKTGLALLTGGAFSNTYDRLRRKYVVDYFSFHTGIRALDRIVFNLADFAIMIGALCAALGTK